MNVATNPYCCLRNIWNGESFMGAVMIKCPDTGRDIATGMVADRVSFNSTPVFFARVHCPLCGAEHEWFAKEAWVCESDPPTLARPTQSPSAPF
jgi:hypothetical protein